MEYVGLSTITPVQEMTKTQLQIIKQATARKVLSLAKQAYPGTTDKDWVLREAIFGDESDAPTTADFDQTTAVATKQMFWGQSATDQTAGNLSSVITAGEKVNKGQFLGIFGFFDLSPVPQLLTGSGFTTAGSMPSDSNCSMMKFKRGGSDLVIYQTEHCYAYEEVMGIFDEPLIYVENEKIQWQTCFGDGTEAKYLGLRTIMCERDGDVFSPSAHTWSLMCQGDEYGYTDPFTEEFVPHIPIGMEPIAELTIQDIQTIKELAKQKLIEVMKTDGSGTGSESFVVRDLVPGDEEDATDFVDLDLVGNQVVGQQRWAQDGGSMTQYTLSNILVASETVPNSKAIAVYGFNDYTQNPSAHCFSWESGGGLLDFGNIEHCYVYNKTGPVGGMSWRIAIFKPTDKILMKVALKDGTADEHWAPKALIIEKWGDQVAQA